MNRVDVIREFDPWKGPLCTCPPKYSLQPYTGCSHRCIYCYATSYIRARNARPKKDFVRRLLRDLRRINPYKPINMSTSSDPYTPEEEKYELTRKALEIMVPLGIKILITTKGTMIVRDLDIVSRGNVAVMITITTMKINIVQKLEPNAPTPKKRMETIQILRESGIPAGVRIDPVIPLINDDPDELVELVDMVADAGAQHIVTSTYKAKPDNLKRIITVFPDIGPELRRMYTRGKRIGGYWYLPRNIRREILDPVIRRARERKLTVATCREGFYFGAPSCDGTHLIPDRIKIRSRQSYVRTLIDFVR